MTIHRFRLLEAVARYRSVTQAANELHMTQSAASHQLKALEIQIGIALTKHSGGRIEMTEAGQTFLQELRPLLDCYGWIEQKYVKKSQRNTERVLIIGGSRGPSVSLLPILMSRFQQEHPSVQLVLRTGTSREIEQMVLDRQIDIGIISNPGSSSRAVVEPYCEENLVLVVSSAHPLAKKKVIEPHELNKARLLIVEGRSGERHAERILTSSLPLGVEPQIAMRFETGTGLKLAVAQGAGVGLLYDHMVDAEVRAGVLKVLPVKNLSLAGQSHIVYLLGVKLFEPAERFREFMREQRGTFAPAAGKMAARRKVA